MRFHTPIGLFLLLLCTSTALAEDAVLRNGKRQAGSLTFDKQGRLNFQPADRSAEIPLANLREVRFAPSVAPLGHVVPFHVALPDEQMLTGHLERCAEGRLQLRTAWETIEVPLAALQSFGPRPGWGLAEIDDFSQGLKAWTIGGKPTLDKQGVVLEVEQSLTRTFAQPLAHGRIGLNFKVNERLQNARGVIQVVVSDGKSKQTLTVLIAEKGVAVEAPGMKGTAYEVAVKAGWQRLEFDIGPGGLRVLIDNEVLWQSKDSLGKHSIVEVMLQCKGTKKDNTGGSMGVGMFHVEHSLSAARRPPGDSRQDELWLKSGDQLFGKLTSADWRGVILDCRGRPRSLTWSDLRGVYPARATLKPLPLTGEQVRVELDNTLQSAPDRLVGVVTGWDAKTLKLKTALLGEIAIPRSAVRAIEGLGYGKREYQALPSP